MVLRHELAVEAGDAGGDGLRLGALGQDDGPEIVVPDEGEDQHGKRRDGGAHERQDDKPEDAPFGDAFDPRGLDQLDRQGLDEVAHEEGAEPGLERDVKEDETQLGVVEVEADGQVAHRHHQDLERHEIARDEHEKDQQVALEPVDAEREAGHARERHRADHRGDGDHQRVQHVARHVAFKEHAAIIAEQVEQGRPAPEIALREIGQGPDGEGRHGDQRQEPQDQRDGQEDLVGDAHRLAAFLDRGGEHVFGPLSCARGVRHATWSRGNRR